MSKYQFFNLNPYKKKTGDCVIRAVACALEIPWEEASDLLYLTARDMGCEMSCIGCYSKLFSDLDLPEVSVKGMTVEEVSDRYPDDVVLIRISGHLTCSRFAHILDIWDCRKERVDRAWLVN